MKTYSCQFLFLIIAASLLYRCSEPKPKDLTSLEGSWNLVEYVPSTSTDKVWESYGDSIIYQKHLTPDHFVWFKYDKANNNLLGLGGGTYVMKDGKYIENINFFFPPGSSELGQSIPFDYKLEGNTWYHKGYAKVYEQSMETGNMTMIDSSKIEEKWIKTTVKPNADTSLVGTWDLVSHRDSLEGSYLEYPDFLGVMKLLTPTHFTFIYYDTDGDEIYSTGSGTYTYNGSTYQEHIDMIYPHNPAALGESIVFSANIDHQYWKHFGYYPIVSIDSSSGKILEDSALIDERWVHHTEEVHDHVIY